MPVRYHVTSVLKARMAGLEARVGELAGQAQAARDDAVAARHLADANDRDVAELRSEIRDFRQANTGSFNAMRADLTDLRAEMHDEFADVRNEMREGFVGTASGFAEVRGKFDQTAAGQEHIAELITTLISQHGEH
ncbi:MAG: permease [Sciscionella sp.]